MVCYEDEKTKAIVFRVNSPGGSIIASEMMRDELLAAITLPVKRKPVHDISRQIFAIASAPG